MNEWLVSQLGVEHALGHSFFLNRSIPLDSPDALDKIWALDIKPLLEEYFFGDGERLREAALEWKRSAERARADTEEDAEEEPEA